jgi:hypothetical protein
MSAISLTKITSDTPLSKRFSLDNEGKLVKGSGGNMRSGLAELLHIQNLSELKNVIGELNINQALAFGVPKGASVGQSLRVLTKRGVNSNPDAISRSRKFFEYPGKRGVLLLDYDPPKNLGHSPSPTELRGMLIQVAPALAQREMLISASASSFIYKDDGTRLNGLRGMHIFLSVADAGDIPAIGAAIDALCWLKGLGHVEISQNGAKLLRSLVDTSVWQPERLSFDAGAHCGSGLYQRRPEPLHFAGRDLTLEDVRITDDDRKTVINLQRQARGLAILPEFDAQNAAFRRKKAASGNGVARLDEPRALVNLPEEKRNEVFKALMHISADCGYEIWIKVGMALATVEDGFELWDAWSAKGSSYPGQSELRYKFSTLGGYPVTLGTVFHIAKGYGYTRPTRERTVDLPVRRMTPEEWHALHEPERKKNTMADVIEVSVAREILRGVMWRWLGSVKARAEKSGDDKLNIEAVIEAVEITTGVGKSTLIREFIPIFKQFGLHVVVVAKDKKQADEYEKAGAFFRRGRECRDKRLLDDDGESYVLTGFDQGIVNHCPHSKKDGPVARLAESEHMISEMCRSGHCAHGNQLMLERAEKNDKPASPVVMKFFQDFPQLRHRVPACTWIPHFEKSQQECVRVVVGAGLGTGDLLRAAGFSSEEVDGVIVDEAVEWVHTNSLSLDDIRKIIVKLEKLVAAINDPSSKVAKDALKDDGFTLIGMSQRERDAISGALALFKGVVPVLGQATLNAGEGEYLSAPADLADLVKDAQAFIGKHGNVWEQTRWERWLTLTASPLRIAFEIVRAAVAGSLTIREGRLNGVYYHPVIEEVAGNIPLLLMDATLDASAKAVIQAKGGNVTRIIAKQLVEIRVDPRRFYSLLNPDDKDYEKRLNQEVEEVMAAKTRNEAETGGGMWSHRPASTRNSGSCVALWENGRGNRGNEQG